MDRRTLITSVACLVAAPAIVRASSLMPVKVISPTKRLFRNLQWVDSSVIKTGDFWYNTDNKTWYMACPSSVFPDWVKSSVPKSYVLYAPREVDRHYYDHRPSVLKPYYNSEVGEWVAEFIAHGDINDG